MSSCFDCRGYTITVLTSFQTTESNDLKPGPAAVHVRAAVRGRAHIPFRGTRTHDRQGRPQAGLSTCEVARCQETRELVALDGVKHSLKVLIGHAHLGLGQTVCADSTLAMSSVFSSRRDILELPMIKHSNL